MRVPISLKTRKELQFQRGKMCEYCQRSEFDHIHHKDGDPSNNDIDNLELLCMRCHQSLHANGFVPDETQDTLSILTNAEVDKIFMNPELLSRVKNFDFDLTVKGREEL